MSHFLPNINKPVQTLKENQSQQQLNTTLQDTEITLNTCRNLDTSFNIQPIKTSSQISEESFETQSPLTKKQVHLIDRKSRYLRGSQPNLRKSKQYNFSGKKKERNEQYINLSESFSESKLNPVNNDYVQQIKNQRISELDRLIINNLSQRLEKPSMHQSNASRQLNGSKNLSFLESQKSQYLSHLKQSMMGHSQQKNLKSQSILYTDSQDILSPIVEFNKKSRFFDDTIDDSNQGAKFYGLISSQQKIKKQQRERTKKTLMQLQDRLREKFEIQTNPLGKNKIQATKIFMEDLKTQFYKYDHKGRIQNGINQEYIQGAAQLIQFFQQILKKKQNKLSISKINEYFNQLLAVLKQTGVPLLQIQCLRMKAKFNMSMGNVYGGLRELFQCKKLTRTNKYHHEKIKCYKNIGKGFLDIKNYAKAKNAFLKLLIMSWYLQNGYLEISAYDYLGMIYFYNGNLRYSKVLHQKSLIGNTEKSQIQEKKIQLYKQQLKLTEDERNLRRLKQQQFNFPSIQKQVGSNEYQDQNLDSSEDESDAFLNEIVSNELLNKNKEQDLFEVQKEKPLAHKQKKKNNNEDEHFDYRNKINNVLHLSHQSYNRLSSNYKQMSRHEIINYKNEEQNIFCYVLTPKVLDKLNVGLQKLWKKIYLVANEIEKFKQIEYEKSLELDKSKDNYDTQINKDILIKVENSQSPKRFQKRATLLKIF